MRRVIVRLVAAGKGASAVLATAGTIGAVVIALATRVFAAVAGADAVSAAALALVAFVVVRAITGAFATVAGAGAVLAAALIFAAIVVDLTVRRLAAIGAAGAIKFAAALVLVASAVIRNDAAETHLEPGAVGAHTREAGSGIDHGIAEFICFSDAAFAPFQGVVTVVPKFGRAAEVVDAASWRAEGDNAADITGAGDDGAGYQSAVPRGAAVPLVARFVTADFSGDAIGVARPGLLAGLAGVALGIVGHVDAGIGDTAGGQAFTGFRAIGWRAAVPCNTFAVTADLAVRAALDARQTVVAVLTTLVALAVVEFIRTDPGLGTSR